MNILFACYDVNEQTKLFLIPAFKSDVNESAWGGDGQTMQILPSCGSPAAKCNVQEASVISSTSLFLRIA